MKTVAKALSLVLFTLPLLASAGTKSASMQVSFVVKDACTVQAGDTAAAADRQAPAVACQLNTPHLVTRETPKAAAVAANSSDAAAVRPAAGAQDWTIYF